MRSAQTSLLCMSASIGKRIARSVEAVGCLDQIPGVGDGSDCPRLRRPRSGSTSPGSRRRRIWRRGSGSRLVSRSSPAPSRAARAQGTATTTRSGCWTRPSRRGRGRGRGRGPNVPPISASVPGASPGALEPSVRSSPAAEAPLWSSAQTGRPKALDIDPGYYYSSSDLLIRRYTAAAGGPGLVLGPWSLSRRGDDPHHRPRSRVSDTTSSDKNVVRREVVRRRGARRDGLLASGPHGHTAQTVRSGGGTRSWSAEQAG